MPVSYLVGVSHWKASYEVHVTNTSGADDDGDAADDDDDHHHHHNEVDDADTGAGGADEYGGADGDCT